MLRPSKHSHPDRTVINLSVVILTRLRRLRIEEYDGLREHVRKSVSGSDVLFLPALNLLYLLGLIEYRPKTDTLEFLEHNEALPALH